VKYLVPLRENVQELWGHGTLADVADPVSVSARKWYVREKTQKVGEMRTSLNASALSKIFEKWLDTAFGKLSISSDGLYKSTKACVGSLRASTSSEETMEDEGEDDGTRRTSN